MHSTMTAVVIHGLRLEKPPGLVGLLGTDASGLGCDDTRGEVTAAGEPTAGAALILAAAAIGAIALDFDTGFGGDKGCGRALAATDEAEPREGKPGNDEPREAEPGDDEPREAEPGDDEPGEVKPGDDEPLEAEPGDDFPGEDQSDDGSVAMPSATLLRAAMTTMGSWPSATRLVDPMRAPAVAASEHPAVLTGSSGRAGELVSVRHRSSQSPTVPPQPRTYAESTGRSGSAGPASAALMASQG
jgi:hypothetical protein